MIKLNTRIKNKILMKTKYLYLVFILIYVLKTILNASTAFKLEHGNYWG